MEQVPAQRRGSPSLLTRPAESRSAQREMAGSKRTSSHRSAGDNENTNCCQQAESRGPLAQTKYVNQCSSRQEVAAIFPVLLPPERKLHDGCATRQRISWNFGRIIFWKPVWPPNVSWQLVKCGAALVLKEAFEASVSASLVWLQNKNFSASQWLPGCFSARVAVR